jgi:hypothetical protein
MDEMAARFVVHCAATHFVAVLRFAAMVLRYVAGLRPLEAVHFFAKAIQK